MTSQPFGTPPPPDASGPVPTDKPVATRTPSLTVANLTFLFAVFWALLVIGTLDAIIFKTENQIRTSLLTEFVGILLPVVGIVIIKKYDLRATFSLKPLAWPLVWRAALLGLLTQLAVVFVANVNQWLFDIFGPFPNLFIPPTQIVPAFGFFFLIAIVPAICEEALNRGIVLAGYRKLGFMRAVILVGVLFGIFHLYPARFGYTAILGALLAYVVLLSGSILASVITHFCFNMSSGLLYIALLAGNQVPPQKPYDYVNPAEFPVQLVISLIFVVLAWLVLRSFTKQAALLRPGIIIGRFGLAKDMVDAEWATQDVVAPFYAPPPIYSSVPTIPPGYAPPNYVQPPYNYPPLPGGLQPPGTPNGQPSQQPYGTPPPGIAPPIGYYGQAPVYSTQPQWRSTLTPGAPSRKWLTASFIAIVVFWLLLGWSQEILVRHFYADPKNQKATPTITQPTTTPGPNGAVQQLVREV